MQWGSVRRFVSFVESGPESQEARGHRYYWPFNVDFTSNLQLKSVPDLCRYVTDFMMYKLYTQPPRFALKIDCYSTECNLSDVIVLNQWSAMESHTS